MMQTSNHAAGTRLRPWVCGLVLAAGYGVAGAQTHGPQDIGRTADGTRVALPSRTYIQRVGNAALVRILQTSSDKENWQFNNWEEVLVSCDGSWMSGKIRSAYDLKQSDKPLSWRAIESIAATETVPLDSVSLEPISAVPLDYAPLLQRRAAELCKTAGSEPRNYVVPFGSGKGTESTQQSAALLLGTAEKRGGRIDLWTRWTDFRKEPWLGPDGNQMEINGVKQFTKVPTGSYRLTRYLVDCADRSIRGYTEVSYQSSGATPVTQEVERLGKMSSVVPDSIGESMLDMTCRLYR